MENANYMEIKGRPKKVWRTKKIIKVYPEVPPKVEYNLTLLGKSVIPVIDLLREWGEEYRSVFIK